MAAQHKISGIASMEQIEHALSRNATGHLCGIVSVSHWMDAQNTSPSA